jgi:hypothetical protein
MHVKYDLDTADGVVRIHILWVALYKSLIYLAVSFGVICSSIGLWELCKIYGISVWYYVVIMLLRFFEIYLVGGLYGVHGVQIQYFFYVLLTVHPRIIL